MSDAANTVEPISDRQLIEDSNALRNPPPHLYAVPDHAHDVPVGKRWEYEAPDVVGIQRQRDRYRAAMPDLSDDELNAYLEVYAHHLSAATKRSYEASLDPFYRAAAHAGFDPLTCDPAQIEAHLLHLMTAGKLGPGGDRNPQNPYSSGYFKTFLAAHKLATQVKSLPDRTTEVNINKLLRGYRRIRGSDLPRWGKDPLLPNELVEIERNAREGTTTEMATRRAAVTLGCDSDIKLGLTELVRLTFADVTFSGDDAIVTTTRRGHPYQTIVLGRPLDPACPVAALKTLREVRYRTMRAKRAGAPPTPTQVNNQQLFVNIRTGKPVTRPGLKHIVSRACAGVASHAPTTDGMPALTLEQRRQIIAPGIGTKTARDLALVFHCVFSSSRVSEVASFDVGDIKIWGRDRNGIDTLIPIVDTVLADGTAIAGILDRVAVVTDTDLVDHSGTSLYRLGVIASVRTQFKHGTKTKNYHQNWYPAQPGNSACPVRLLIQWLKVYDRLLIAHRGTRLTADRPLFTNLRDPGHALNADSMSRMLGRIVKAAVSELGLDPRTYSAHSLRKVRATYVLARGGSQIEVMLHDARSSEAQNLVYAHRDPRNPFAGDPTVRFYDDVPDYTPNPKNATPGPETPATLPQPATAPTTNVADLTTNTPDYAPTMDTATRRPETPAHTPPHPTAPTPAKTPATSQPATAPDPTIAIAELITEFQGTVNKLRSAGLDDPTIAALAKLQIP